MSHILTLSDRTVIQTLLKVGYSQKQIAKEIGVAPSTINYELKRCPKGYYDADQAQEDCEKKLTRRGWKTPLQVFFGDLSENSINCCNLPHAKNA